MRELGGREDGREGRKESEKGGEQVNYRTLNVQEV